VKFESAGEMRGGVDRSGKTSAFSCWAFDGDTHNFDTSDCRSGLSGEGGHGSSSGSGGSDFT
jgi:hypothetical protein